MEVSLGIDNFCNLVEVSSFELDHGNERKIFTDRVRYRIHSIHDLLFGIVRLFTLKCNPFSESEDYAGVSFLRNSEFKEEEGKIKLPIFDYSYVDRADSFLEVPENSKMIEISYKLEVGGGEVEDVGEQSDSSLFRLFGFLMELRTVVLMSRVFSKVKELSKGSLFSNSKMMVGIYLIENFLVDLNRMSHDRLPLNTLEEFFICFISSQDIPPSQGSGYKELEEVLLSRKYKKVSKTEFIKRDTRDFEKDLEDFELDQFSEKSQLSEPYKIYINSFVGEKTTGDDKATSNDKETSGNDKETSGNNKKTGDEKKTSGNDKETSGNDNKTSGDDKATGNDKETIIYSSETFINESKERSFPSLSSPLNLEILPILKPIDDPPLTMRDCMSNEGYTCAHKILIKELLNVAYLAFASYGDTWPVYFLERRRTINPKVISDKNRRTILEMLDIEDKYLLPLSSSTPSHIIFFDEVKNRLVVSFKGTTTHEEAIHDLDCEYGTFYEGLAHKGFKMLAVSFVEEKTQEILTCLETFNTKDLLLTGHSLGGSLATLVSIIFIREGLLKGFNIITLSFSPAPVVSYDLARKFHENMFTIIYKNDYIPRLSYGSLAEMKFICCSLSLMIRLTKESLESKLESIRNCLNQRHLFPKLYHPGRIYNIKRVNVLKGGDRISLLLYKEVSQRFFESLFVLRHAPKHHLIVHIASILKTCMKDYDSFGPDCL